MELLLVVALLILLFGGDFRIWPAGVVFTASAGYSGLS